MAKIETFAFFIILSLWANAVVAGSNPDAHKRTAKDSNHDGRPDRFSLFLKERNLVLKEADTNADGKIDQRALVEWDANKQMTIMTNRVERITVPGYRTLWKEEDKDFDGVIDAYYERSKKDAASKKIGQRMDQKVTLNP